MLFSANATRSISIRARTITDRGLPFNTSSIFSKYPPSSSSRHSFSSVAPPTSDANSKKASTNKREIHSESPRLQYGAVSASYFPETKTKSSSSSSETNVMMERFKVTAEVTVSKIFPAGFAWQSSSILADSILGYTPDSMGFALTTGLGDAIGVFAGHCVYFFAKKHVVDSQGSDGKVHIDMEKEVQTGLLLGSAAFFSGTAWQPIVNALQGMELPFFQVFAGTWIGCATAFYFGLRTARTVLSGPLKHVHYPSFENSRTDKSLSLAIGGATGFFVGTDATYLPAENFLLNVVGIHEGMSPVNGCLVAGSSTSLGFLTAQTTLNTIYPTGRLWNDGK
ncbi:hypothetical protein HJC23_008461 [Cyclotella cryptica]|uniref:Uncharacterized protein n=1 Tax=Cyclotella cryptica TaxID=29204 RepID=A0ABD3QXZ6_9STRA|eukprot:CCRYP_001180-RA/>CCRYP_001180-RA protein AED:0.04 eAED:0.04 QI:372/1/1/1/0.5/0.33/3/711/337